MLFPGASFQMQSILRFSCCQRFAEDERGGSLVLRHETRGYYPVEAVSDGVVFRPQKIESWPESLESSTTS